MKTEDKIFNKHMTLRTGNIDYMSRSAFHRAMKEYSQQPSEGEICNVFYKHIDREDHLTDEGTLSVDGFKAAIKKLLNR